MPDDIDHLEAHPQPRHPRRLLRPRVRVLGFMLPPAAIAWTTAVAAHLAAIGSAVLIIRLSSGSNWVGRGSPFGGLVQNHDGAGEALSSNLPAPAAPGGVMPPALWPQPVSLHAPDNPSNSADEAPAQWSTRHTAPTIDFPSDDNPDFRLGNAQGAPPNPAPNLRGHANPSFAKSGVPAPSDESASGGGGVGSGNGSESTGPGLPGALLGSGLPHPHYPEDARRRREQGTVRISLEVLEDGSLGAITLVTDAGHPSLGKAALAAANRLRPLRFQPAQEAGHPVKSVLVVPYVFQLK